METENGKMACSQNENSNEKIRIRSNCSVEQYMSSTDTRCCGFQFNKQMYSPCFELTTDWSVVGQWKEHVDLP